MRSSPTNSRPIRNACARPPGLRLHRVADRKADLAAVAQQALEAADVVRRRDQQDVADPASISVESG